MKKENIILVGFMGTGKTTVGQMVAERLGRPFIDMDTIIEERAGKKISDIFANEGEAHFRRLERDLVRELCRKWEQVIAPGGGIVLNPDNIRDFDETGMVICLLAEPEAILERVGKESHRPLLETDDKARAVTDLLNKRRPFYHAIPQQIDTTHLSAAEVADRVIELFLHAG